ncbi:7753_t:CDS:2, partial [Acaulospora colombiana]
KKQFNKDEAIREYKRLIGKLPLANQYLLLYVLDLLTVFARKSDINKMTAGNLAVIFRPAVLNHPGHEMSPEHHKLSQEVLEFLIEHQDWFMLDIPPPPRQDSILNTNATNQTSAHRSKKPFGLITNRGPMSTKAEPAPVMMMATTTNEPDDLNVYVGPASDEEDDGGWRLAGSTNGTATLGRRRTFSERGSPRMMTADEQGRMGGDGRKSVENISQSAPSTSSAFKQATKQLTPVREGSSGDIDAMMVTGGSVEVPSAESSSNERRAKFDDTRLAKDDAIRGDDREKRGRASSKGTGLFGSVRRSRTVEGTSNMGTSAVAAAAGGTGPQRHVLKKRNSRGEVER